jgi:hypothetical protein
MYNDLAQMASAKGIYRTLAICAILSHKPVRNEISKYQPEKDTRKPDEQVCAEDVEVKNERMD